MELKFDQQSKKTTREDINNLERKYHIKLPHDYIDFLLKQNCGYIANTDDIAYNLFDYSNHDVFVERALLNTIFCPVHDESIGLSEMFDAYKNRIPFGFVPVGGDPGGNLICISTNKEDFGYVYFWSHEEESGDETRPSYDNIYFVATSFDHFIASLIKFSG